jgi:hypothetical protein
MEGADEGDEDDGDTTGGNDDTNLVEGSASMTTVGTTVSTTGMTTSPTDPTDPTGGEETMSFLVPPDGGIEGQCDPAAQDCPKGQKCTGYVDTPGGETVDSNHCVEVMGDLQFGEQCTRIDGNDDCAAGFFCMTDISGHTGMGICLEYCEVGQACDFGGECFAFNDGQLPLCEQLCHPLAPVCPADQGCYAVLTFNNFVCATSGAPDGGGADDDECFTIQGCNPGLVCSGGTEGCTTESGCCTPVCDLTEGPEQCTAMTEECIAAFEDPPPGLEDVGICAVPM